MGKENYERFGNEFPLLVKFHWMQRAAYSGSSNRRTSTSTGFKCGKIEMWYVERKADADALSAAVFEAADYTTEQYKEIHTITEALSEYPVMKATYSSCQQVVFTLSVQAVFGDTETSDVTYRIYDFKRQDGSGQLSSLHTQGGS